MLRAIARARRMWVLDRLHTPSATAPSLRQHALLRARGYFGCRGQTYPLDRFPLALFLSDREIELKLFQLCDPATRGLLRDKLGFDLMVRAAGLARLRPQLLGLLIDGRFVGRQPLTTSSDLASAVEQAGSVIVKPLVGQSGRNVVLIDQPGTVGRAKCLDRGVYVVEERITQHEDMSRLFRGSVNTVRIITMLAPDTGEPFVAGVALRIGTMRSAPTDNAGRGGLRAAVDVMSGRVGSAMAPPSLGPVRRLSVHPDTGAAVAGVVLPRWDDVCRAALQLAQAFPWIPYVGWDLAIAPDGPRVVEGNGGVANPSLVQAELPLLLDPKVRYFLQHHGVLTPGRARSATRAATRSGLSRQDAA